MTMEELEARLAALEARLKRLEPKPKARKPYPADHAHSAFRLCQCARCKPIHDKWEAAHGKWIPPHLR